MSAQYYLAKQVNEKMEILAKEQPRLKYLEYAYVMMMDCPERKVAKRKYKKHKRSIDKLHEEIDLLVSQMD